MSAQKEQGCCPCFSGCAHTHTHTRPHTPTCSTQAHKGKHKQMTPHSRSLALAHTNSSHISQRARTAHTLMQRTQHTIYTHTHTQTAHTAQSTHTCADSTHSTHNTHMRKQKIQHTQHKLARARPWANACLQEDKTTRKFRAIGVQEAREALNVHWQHAYESIERPMALKPLPLHALLPGGEADMQKVRLSIHEHGSKCAGCVRTWQQVRPACASTTAGAPGV